MYVSQGIYCSESIQMTSGQSGNMRLSIAMATYNGADYIGEQLESLFKQTRQPHELIVCDDGSNDATLELLEEFKKRVPFAVRIFRNKENIGHERNFGKAIDLCAGDLIFLCDQDDVWFPSKLEVIEKIFRANKNILLVVNDAEITDGYLNPTGRTVFGQSKAAGVFGQNGKSLTLGCATAFRAELRSLISPVPALEYGHDSWIHDFTHIIDGRYVLDEELQFYRRHGKNVSNWVFDGSERASMKAVMRPSAGKDLRPAYEKRIATLELMTVRVRDLGQEGYGKLNASTSYANVLLELKHAISALNNRKLIFTYGWARRKLLAIGMWSKGDYRYFLGWKSFLKDLLR